jgi:hypothetical protein
MKGDFSRLRFSPNKNYTSVLEQQGRVSLDADANEQCAINDYLRTTETVDVVGPVGGPIHDEGFKITVVGDTIEIGAGRYYVEGILCENEQVLHYADQPYLIHPTTNGPELLAGLREGKISVVQFYLQVWRRLVTVLDDPCLREPALGLADTTARLQTVWRVVAHAVEPAVNKPVTNVPSAPASLQLSNSSEFVTTPTQQATANSSLATLSVNDAGLEINPIDVLIGGTCCDSMVTGLLPVRDPGTMSAQTSGGSGNCTCEPTPAAGYRGLENQLYRVEIHHSGAAAAATFKWSRENASVVVAITGVSGSQVYVDSLGPEANLGFAVGQWVEISDDTNLFGQPPNQPGDLYQITNVTPETLCITLSKPVASVDPTRNARLRRWDQFGSSATSNGISLSEGSWLDLENGIQVQFSRGEYVSGDYWLIPARTATGSIEWPPCNSDGNDFQPAHRIEIFYAPLACVQWDFKRREAHVQDCRKSFYPLTELTPPASATALHVSNISWSNDDVTTFDQLVANGITVTLDQAPTGPINGANFVVTLEPPAPPASTNDATGLANFKAAAGGLPSTILRGITIVDAEITITSGTLFWQLPFANANLAQRLTMVFLDDLLSFGAPYRWFARARVRLLGRAVFAGSGVGQLFLDGQSFGQAALRADGKTPRIDLQLPSGNNEKASDFEGWFYVAPTLLLIELKVEYPALTVVVDANNNVTGVQASVGGQTQTVIPKAGVKVSYPVIADTTITLALSGPSGVGSVASIPSTVTVKENEVGPIFPISIVGNPGAGTTLTFQITASLTSAVGLVGAQTASFTVTAGQVPAPAFP